MGGTSNLQLKLVNVFTLFDQKLHITFNFSVAGGIVEPQTLYCWRFTGVTTVLNLLTKKIKKKTNPYPIFIHSFSNTYSAQGCRWLNHILNNSNSKLEGEVDV